MVLAFYDVYLGGAAINRISVLPVRYTYVKWIAIFVLYYLC